GWGEGGGMEGGVTNPFFTAPSSRAAIACAARVEICWEMIDRTSMPKRSGWCHSVQGPIAAIRRLSTLSRRARGRWAFGKTSETLLMPNTSCKLRAPGTPGADLSYRGPTRLVAGGLAVQGQRGPPGGSIELTSRGHVLGLKCVTE